MDSLRISEEEVNSGALKTELELNLRRKPFYPLRPPLFSLAKRLKSRGDLVPGWACLHGLDQRWALVNGGLVDCVVGWIRLFGDVRRGEERHISSKQEFLHCEHRQRRLARFVTLVMLIHSIFFLKLPKHRTLRLKICDQAFS